jgi:hypothetical protein
VLEIGNNKGIINENFIGECARGLETLVRKKIEVAK